jgi:alpha-glucosidase (family GH31 glycosyl hydrolase)
MRRRTFLKNSAAMIASVGTWGRAAWAQARRTSAAMPPGIPHADASEWGLNTATLKASWPSPPTAKDMLTDSRRVLTFDRFFRVGGDPRAATPTECRIAHDAEGLVVVFRAAESDMSFPYAALDEALWARAKWNSLRGLPSGANSSWPPFPDEVDLFVQPDPERHVYYQFAATLQGRAFGAKRTLNPESDIAPNELAAGRDTIETVDVTGFGCKVERLANEWTAYFRIPWQVLGGRPMSHLGLLPMRTRWRDGECSAPVALDYNEGLPVDVLIETYMAEPPKALDVQDSLCRMPSGKLRWQVPARRAYPGPAIREKIWALQSSLHVLTDGQNLASRLYLVQRWTDLLTLEGFTPLKTGWALLPKDYSISYFRQQLNAAFHAGALDRAYRLLDEYLRQLDTVSRWWFADGSPSNLLKDEWNSVTGIETISVSGDTLLMKCAVGGRTLDLRLALPATGGVRLFTEHEGYWRPQGLAPLKAVRAGGAWMVEGSGTRISVQEKPFSITVSGQSGRDVLKLEGAHIAFRFGPKDQIRATDLRIPLQPEEAIFGFGEQYDQFNRAGGIVTIWQCDDTIGNGKGLANASYKQIPVFHSTRPYMIFSNSSYRIRADVGCTEPGTCRLSQHGPVFDYYFWPTAADAALKSYTALTGRPPVPPKWAFEPWMGRGGGAWADGRIKDSLAWSIGELGDSIAEEKDVTERFAALDIPHSAIYAEGPTALSPELNAYMASRNIRVLGYFRPEIPPVRQKQLMPEFAAADLPIVHCGSEAETNKVAYVDFTHKNAAELCRRALQPAFALGEAGSMVDFGDWTPDSAMFANGQTGVEMHNFYCYDYHRTVSQVFREHRGDDVILYGRGAAPGTQGWLGQFAGDHPANFEGLRHVLTGALNLCACGFSTWGSDIGGYFGFPEPAVYMRWVQLGCFSPLMRPHGIAPREPWFFGDAAVRNYKFLAWTRENLVDYIHHAATIAYEHGLPIMRSMPIAFPGQPQIAAVPDQYMFGPDLLVAPVLSEGVFRTVTVPTGRWISLWDGKAISGPGILEVAAPLETIPVYLREGAVMPLQLSHSLKFGDSMTKGRVSAILVTPGNSSGTTLLSASRGGTAKVEFAGKPNAGRWTFQRVADLDAVLVYGSRPVAEIKLDGLALARARTNALAPSAVGEWYQDKIGNRVVIRLPKREPLVSEPSFSLEIDYST